jgi:predicted phosphodiesterase
MSEQIGWLHVSDFHFRASDDPLSQTVAVNALIEDVRDRTHDRAAPSFVVVTGDVAFSGLQQEYEAARPFLDRLASAAGVVRDRFYFVPGNHDVDRSRNRFAYVGASTQLTSEAEIDRALGSLDIRPLFDRQAAFWDFVETFTDGQERTSFISGLAYVASIPVGRHVITLLGLNSAWLSGRNGEEMRLLIGERQIIEGLDMTNAFDPLFQIAIAHHPVEWMSEWDQGVCRTRLFNACDVFHRGHLHQSEVALAGGPDSPCLSVAAGSGHATRFYGNSYNWIELELGTGECSVSAFRLDPAIGRYQPASTITGHIKLRGSLPGSAGDISKAIARLVPEAAPYAGYMSALLVGEKEEVPVRNPSGVDFMIPTVARELAGDAVRPIEEFLRLRNLLRLYPDGVPLDARMAEHQDVVAGLIQYLQALGPLQNETRERLGSPVLELSPYARPTELPQTVAFLEELQRRGEWHVLELQAGALLENNDVRVGAIAKALLIEALMHSDETEKRVRAAHMGAELLTDNEATLDEYLLAAASAEVVGEGDRAVEHTAAALNRWPTDPTLRTFARGLATRMGSAALRALIGVEVDGSDERQ